MRIRFIPTRLERVPTRLGGPQPMRPSSDHVEWDVEWDVPTRRVASRSGSLLTAAPR